MVDEAEMVQRVKMEAFLADNNLVDAAAMVDAAEMAVILVREWLHLIVTT